MTTPEQAPADQVREALELAIQHLAHLAAWVSRKQTGGLIGSYSFEALGEDMPRIKSALSAPVAPVEGRLLYDTAAVQAVMSLLERGKAYVDSDGYLVLSQPTPQQPDPDEGPMSKCRTCGARYPSAPEGTLHKCGLCEDGICDREPTPQQPDEGVTQEVQWEIWQDDMMVASSTSEADAHHYLAVYSQDGPAHLVRAETTRHRLSTTAGEK